MPDHWQGIENLQLSGDVRLAIQMKDAKIKTTCLKLSLMGYRQRAG